MLAESVPIPGGSDAVADGGPPPAGACGRSCGSQGGSIVGEGRGGRDEAEVGVSAGSAGGTLDSAGTGPSTSDSYARVSETSYRADLMGEGTPQPRGVGLQCSWGMHTAGQVPACLVEPQYTVPLACWRCEEGGLGHDELGGWRDLCPLHAATVSYVLMADTEDSFRKWYYEACRDLGYGPAFAAVEAQEQQLRGLELEPAEIPHSTDGGQAALFATAVYPWFAASGRLEFKDT